MANLAENWFYVRPGGHPKNIQERGTVPETFHMAPSCKGCAIVSGRKWLIQFTTFAWFALNVVKPHPAV